MAAVAAQRSFSTALTRIVAAALALRRFLTASGRLNNASRLYLSRMTCIRGRERACLHASIEHSRVELGADRTESRDPFSISFAFFFFSPFTFEVYV